MFNEKSRYYNKPGYEVKAENGKNVTVVAVPDASSTAILGFHLLKQGQRTDHLAAQYLNDAAAFWRICDANNVMLPEALTEKAEIAVPNKY
jgi:hypothetical protein